jgi:hypothetical protein
MAMRANRWVGGPSGARGRDRVFDPASATFLRPPADTAPAAPSGRPGPSNLRSIQA